MSAVGCGDPDGCPVPDPADVDLRRLASVTLAAGTPLRRGHKSRCQPNEPAPARPDLPPRTQMSRFAPLRNQPHLSVARREIAALLESTLHSLVPDRPRIHWPQLRRGRGAPAGHRAGPAHRRGNHDVAGQRSRTRTRPGPRHPARRSPTTPRSGQAVTSAPTQTPTRRT